MLSHKKAALQKFSVARAPCFIVVVVGHEKIGEQQMDKNFASKASASFTESSLVFAKDVEPYLMHFFVKPRLSSLQYDPPPPPYCSVYLFSLITFPCFTEKRETSSNLLLSHGPIISDISIHHFPILYNNVL